MKNIVIFVNAIRPQTFDALKQHELSTGQKLIPVVLVDKNIRQSLHERNGQLGLGSDHIVIEADFDDPYEVRSAVAPYYESIFAVTCQYENSIHELKKLVPYFTNVPMPTESSLDWSTEKILMRSLLESYDPKLSPKYIKLDKITNENVDYIDTNFSYPLIVKPSGLEGSLLVTKVDNKIELLEALQSSLNSIKDAYTVWIKRNRPLLIVEEFMQGDMYSVDTYISSRGNCVHTPLVRVITGADAGHEGFYGYKRITPTDLTNDQILDAQTVAAKACEAVGLRSITAHIEMMHTPNGWKIIELGPRIGGYRHDLYMQSYKINHIVNDILNRADQPPIVPKLAIQKSVMFNIYATHEGLLHSMHGLEVIQNLESFIGLRQILSAGDELYFAKNNGDPVLEVFLSHSELTQLHKDIFVVENELKIQVEIKN